MPSWETIPVILIDQEVEVALETTNKQETNRQLGDTLPDFQCSSELIILVKVSLSTAAGQLKRSEG